MSHELKQFEQQRKKALWTLHWPRLSLFCFGQAKKWDGIGFLCFSGLVGALLYGLGHWMNSSDDILWLWMGAGVFVLTVFLYGLNLFSSLEEPVTIREEESIRFFSLCFIETQQAYLIWQRKPLKRLHYLVMIDTVKTLHQLYTDTQIFHQQIHDQHQEELRQLGQTFLNKYFPQILSNPSQRQL